MSEKESRGNQTDIGKRISEKRKELDMKQQQFADIVKVTRSNIANWESDRLPPVDRIPDLANALGVSCDYLLTGVQGWNATIAKDIGLGNSAIESLKSNGYLQKVVNCLLSSSDGIKMLSAIGTFISLDFDWIYVDNHTNSQDWDGYNKFGVGNWHNKFGVGKKIPEETMNCTIDPEKEFSQLTPDDIRNASALKICDMLKEFGKNHTLEGDTTDGKEK